MIPKRLRYFVHRDKRLAGELSRILGAQLNRFYARKGGAGSVPAQMHAIQRFGSRVNLHVHVHAIVSDGAFSLENGCLRFHPAPQPSLAELAALSRLIRRKVLLRMRMLKAVPEEALEELLARPLGGFSLDGSVRLEAEDRAGLLRLLGYITRPAISVKRFSYKPGVVRYWPKKGHDGMGLTRSGRRHRRLEAMFAPAAPGRPSRAGRKEKEDRAGRQASLAGVDGKGKPGLH